MNKNNVLEYRSGDTTTCGLCLGMNRCYVLAPMKGDLDRKRWPADFRQAYWEDLRRFTTSSHLKPPSASPGFYHPQF